MKKLLSTRSIYFASISLAVVFLSFQANAVEVKNNTLLYISPTYYQHSLRLLHPFYDYWFEQGPLLEPIALHALQAQDASMQVCQSGQTANRIIRITPNIFYNPQMRVYHSQIQANVYSGGGSLLGTYVGKATQQGNNSVDNGLQNHLKSAYALAMQDLMHKINLNHTASETDSETKISCTIIGAQVEPALNLN